jgi:hypothetical protein
MNELLASSSVLCLMFTKSWNEEIIVFRVTKTQKWSLFFEWPILVATRPNLYYCVPTSTQEDAR